MEDLTNSQIVLLAILISFVTSMASAIITTSLLDEAPIQVGQTVNRVVERTIERVVPEESNGEAEIIRETIVVTEDDQVVSAIGKNEPSLVRIVSGGLVIGVGFVIDSDGTIITDGTLVAQGVTYIAKTTSGDIEVQTFYDPNDKIALLKPTVSITDSPSINLIATIPKLGQTVVSLGGFSSNAILTGRVLQLAQIETGTTTPAVNTDIASISTDVISASPGSILMNLSGEVVGMRIGSLAQGDFLPSAKILSAVEDSKVE